MVNISFGEVLKDLGPGAMMRYDMLGILEARLPTETSEETWGVEMRKLLDNEGKLETIDFGRKFGCAYRKITLFF